MSDFNRVILVGNLTRDPELRYTPSGQAVCNLGLAINREFKDKQDQKQKDTTFLRVTVWGKQGESCGTYLKKGRPVLVEGRLQSSNWEDKDGKKMSSVEVVAERVQFLGGRDNGGQRNDQASQPEGGDEDGIPF